MATHSLRPVKPKLTKDTKDNININIKVYVMNINQTMGPEGREYIFALSAMEQPQ